MLCDVTNAVPLLYSDKTHSCKYTEKFRIPCIAQAPEQHLPSVSHTVEGFYLDFTVEGLFSDCVGHKGLKVHCFLLFHMGNKCCFLDGLCFIVSTINISSVLYMNKTNINKET